ncbi:DUF6519 domain-containing protein [Solirubrobacter soli]|uniref:DUF6519 domain-containing protein n=1 Tax=Solirubrobacter soli TaxID=363832 RepID=UPI0003FF18E6|nr:DUF6519 domain-containing protein [Solirubrobacter soli]
MRGTRYGDFSRLGVDTAKGYRGLLLQQGRVQLDADFNDRGELAERALRTALGDLFGPAAAPAAAPGFGIRTRMGLEFTGTQRLVLAEVFDRDRHTLELWLSWYGRAGVLVDCRDRDRTAAGYTVEIEDDGTLRLVLEGEGISARRTLRTRERLPVRTPVLLSLVFGSDFVALYLDSRQVVRDAYRGVHLDRPEILIGGPIHEEGDGFVGLISEARVWRTARTLPEIAATATQPPTAGEDPDLHAMLAFDEGEGPLLADAVSGQRARVRGGEPAWRLLDLVIDPGRLYVDGVACEQLGQRRYGEQGVGPLPTEGAYLVYLEAWEESVSAVQDPGLREVALGGLDTSVATRIATRVRLTPLDLRYDDDVEQEVQATADQLALPSTGRLAADHDGDHAPGNYLYRVEIQSSGRVGGGSTPTFKWSRDNGASLFALAGAREGETEVGVLPSGGSFEPLAPGDVVEPLAAAAGLDDRGHPLARVLRVSETGDRVELDIPLEAGCAYLRRWQPGAAERGKSAELPAGAHWTELEDGIRVRFEPGGYRRGDYWWIVARLDLRGIEWPRDAGHPVALPPAGVERLTAPLALLRLDDDAVRIEDLRRIVTAIVAERPSPMPRPDPPADDTDDDVDVVVVTDDDGDVVEVIVVDDEEPSEEVDEPRWRARSALELPGDRLQGAVSAGGMLVVASDRELFEIGVDSGDVSTLAPLPTRRLGLELCALEDLILLIGGGEEPDELDGHVYAFELSTGEWSARAKLPARRAHPAVAVARGHVHAIGGRREGTLRHGVQGAHHVYHPETDKWTEAKSLPTHRSGAAAEALGDHVHVVGGFGAGRPARAHTEHELYDLDEGKWHRAPELPEPGPVVGSATHAGRHVVLVDNARRAGPQATLAYDHRAARWHALPSLPERVRRPVVAAHRERVYVVGERADGVVVLYEFG